jgi:hypothetical protein
MFFALCIPAAIVRTDIKETHRRALRKAIERVYPSEGAACVDMAVKQSHFSEEMAGERSLNLDHKSNLDVRVWSWYAVFLAAEFGIPEELDVAQRLDVGTKTMARMDATSVQRRRTA